MADVGHRLNKAVCAVQFVTYEQRSTFITIVLVDGVEVVLSEHIGAGRQRGPGVDPRHLDDVELGLIAHQRRTTLITDQLDAGVFKEPLGELLGDGVVDLKDATVELDPLDVARPHELVRPDIGSATNADHKDPWGGPLLDGGGQRVERAAQVFAAQLTVLVVGHEGAGIAVLHDPLLLAKLRLVVWIPNKRDVVGTNAIGNPDW